MRECVSGTGLALWNSDEFELQVCGSPSIPIEELKKQTRFSGGDAQAAATFWSAIGASFTNSGTLLHYTSMASRFRQCRTCTYLRSERRSHYSWSATPLSPCTNLDAVYTSTAAKLSDEERSALLKFVTGRIRLPVSLKVEWSGGDSDLLPTSATCYQAIYMPLCVVLRFLPRSQRMGATFARKTRHPYDVQWWMT